MKYSEWAQGTYRSGNQDRSAGRFYYSPDGVFKRLLNTTVNSIEAGALFLFNFPKRFSGRGEGGRPQQPTS